MYIAIMRWSLVLLLAACGGGGDAVAVPDTGQRIATLDELRSTTSVAVRDSTLVIDTSLDAAGAGLPPDLEITAAANGVTGTGSLTYTETFHTIVALGAPPAEDTPVSVTISLAGDSATASVTIPAAFTIDQVTGNPYVPPFTISWSPTRSDPMVWIGTVSRPAGHMCSGDSQESPPFHDDGSLTFDHALASGPSFCIFSVSIVRERAGTVTGTAASGSSITARQSKDVVPR